MLASVRLSCVRGGSLVHVDNFGQTDHAMDMARTESKIREEDLRRDEFDAGQASVTSEASPR